MKNCILMLLISFITSLLDAQIKFRESELAYNRVKSLYQEDSTSIITIQTKFAGSDSLTIIFVLPVEEQKEICRFGSGIQEIKELIDSNLISNNIVFVQAGFTRIPWYGDHPENIQKWQEKYLIDVISQVSLIFRNYHKRIYLLGFSKSGWGSMSVLLNYPGIIDGVFIWDTPFLTKFKKKWSMDQVFRDKKYFNNKYLLTKRICKAADVLTNKSIVIGGSDMFKKQSKTFVRILDTSKIKYSYNPDLKYNHEWNKKWIYALLRYEQGIIQDAKN